MIKIAMNVSKKNQKSTKYTAKDVFAIDIIVYRWFLLFGQELV